jgi:hypothetical protein
MSNTETTVKTPAKKWTEESSAELLIFVGDASPVSAETVAEAAVEMGVSERSISAKLRKLGREVASLAKQKASSFSADETEQLTNFIEQNDGELTYKQIAEGFLAGKFTAKQIQGKILALQLTGSVKASEKVEVANKYSEEEEVRFIALANAGKFIEEIAEEFARPVASIRGKALSLVTKGLISNIPVQRDSHAKDNVDAVTTLGDKISEMTVAEIAVATEKTERGIKTILTRRGIKAADYDGKAKQAKAHGKAEDAKAEQDCA